jgi:hypothetical protein
MIGEKGRIWGRSMGAILPRVKQRNALISLLFPLCGEDGEDILAVVQGAGRARIAPGWQARPLEKIEIFWDPPRANFSGKCSPRLDFSGKDSFSPTPQGAAP